MTAQHDEMTDGARHHAPARLRVDVLGPLLIGGTTEHGLAPMPARLLALMALHSDQCLTVERLQERLWGVERPSSANVTLQTYICHIRRALAEVSGMSTKWVSREALVTRGRSYMLGTEHVGIDVVEWTRLRHAGISAFHLGDHDRAVTLLRRAVALRRADAATAFGGSTWTDDPTVLAIDEAHLSTQQYLIEAEIARGGERVVLHEVMALAQQNPFHEELQRLQAVCLYGAGRRRDALRGIANHRRRLSSELGLDLSDGLVEVQRRILVGA